MFNKLKQNNDLSKQSIEQKAQMERVMKHAEKILETAKEGGLTLQELRMSAEVANRIIAQNQDAKKLTDILSHESL